MSSRQRQFKVRPFQGEPHRRGYRFHSLRPAISTLQKAELTACMNQFESGIVAIFDYQRVGGRP
jgi:hypothetical protein